MQRLKRIDEFVTTPPPRSVIWAEMVIISAGFPLLGYWVHAQDPFFIQSNFPWLLLAPLLVGLRYGSGYALGSAALLIAAVLFSWKSQWFLLPQNPAIYSLGLLIVALLSGEFRDSWQRRQQRLMAASALLEERLDEVSHAYQLLKISHDTLGRRVAAKSTNLRDCILNIRRQVQQAESSSAALPDLAPLLIRLFANLGSLSVASLHRVDGDRVEEKPLATYGHGAYIDLDDPLLREALASGKAVALKPKFAEEPEVLIGRLLVVVPLVDVEGDVWALLAVQQMPFRAFHTENIRVLAIIAGHLGDLLLRRVSGVQSLSGAEEDFLFELERSLMDRQRFDLDAALLGLRLNRAEHADLLTELVAQRHRGLDRHLILHDPGGVRVVLLLMPLTDRRRCDEYLQRLEGLLRERGLSTLKEMDVAVIQRELVAGDQRDRLLEEFHQLCGLTPPAGEQAA